MTSQRCFYVPGTASIIDLADVYPPDHPGRVDDQVRSHCVGETLAEVQKRYPLAEERDLAEVVELVQAAQKAQYTTLPTPITKERFIEMLEVLPPIYWHRGSASESFKMSEFLIGNLTSIYVRIGSGTAAHYYTFTDNYRLTHDEILAIIRKNGDDCVAMKEHP